MERSKIAVLVLCLGCLQFGCKNSAEAGASESQAKKVPRSARLRQKLEKDAVLTLIKERGALGLPEPLKTFVPMPGKVVLEDAATLEQWYPASEEERSAINKRENLNLEFYRRLVSAGLLLLYSQDDSTDDKSRTLGSNTGKVFYFKPKSDDLVLDSQYYRPDFGFRIIIARIRSSFDVVSIEQQSGEAAADVEFKWEYTEAWKTLQRVCSSMSGELTPIRATIPISQFGLSECVSGAGQEAPAPLRKTFYFKYFRRVVEGDIEGWYLVDQYGRRQ